jgi:glycosyltransferase involved in cell wall biosynthesis
MEPLVTVICISYNHAVFVYEALLSIRCQTYTSIQIIIADDASTDGSRSEIQRFISAHPELTVISILNEQNTGNCMLFNKALQVAKGKYIIDLAADDWLYPSCIEKQVTCFESLSTRVGVVFTNVDLVDEKGRAIKKHYPVNAEGKAIAFIPQGDVYKKIVEHYFVSPVGMIMRKEVLDALGGYDESLAYEDFDFWVRLSRSYEYAYLDACLVAKRIIPHSHSTKFLKQGQDAMFLSTARVCQKIAWLNKNEEERQALLKRMRYEVRQALKYDVKEAVEIYYSLFRTLNSNMVLVKCYALYYTMKNRCHL